jgi:hypothetical protein
VTMRYFRELCGSGDGVNPPTFIDFYLCITSSIGRVCIRCHWTES